MSDTAAVVANSTTAMFNIAYIATLGGLVHY
jgi:hypothetical protein